MAQTHKPGKSEPPRTAASCSDDTIEAIRAAPRRGPTHQPSPAACAINS